MSDNLTGFPIKTHPTWLIHDSSKLQDFEVCPRMYLFLYGFGWRREGPNQHLVFGESWHRLMEHLHVHGLSNDSAVEAHNVFLKNYRETFPESTDEACYPKNPDNALLALGQYLKRYGDEKFETLYTEVSGTVPVDDERKLHFRLDSLIKDERGIVVREHKTTGKESRSWNDQWILKIATGTYTHVAYCMFEEHDVWGLEINAAIFRSSTGKGNTFLRIPIRKAKDMMEVWHWNVLHVLDLIEWNFAQLKECKDSDSVLRCFHMRTESCTKYFGCQFLPYCTIWANPLRNASEPPPGVVEYWWNPADREKESKHVVHLEESKEVIKQEKEDEDNN